ncbi:MAG: glutaredoxin [Gammaproteobacteria bacterium]|nr:glutaredoxin [Gammaproteobacteria bacterium]
MASFTVYSTGTCPICDKTKTLLKKWSIAYDEIRLDLEPSQHRAFSELTNGARTVPQIAIDGKWIGSFSELTEMHMDGELDQYMPSS